MSRDFRNHNEAKKYAEEIRNKGFKCYTEENFDFNGKFYTVFSVVKYADLSARRGERGKHMVMNIINKAGVDLSLLIRRLKHYEELSHCVVLKVHIFEDRNFILVEYNGIVVTKWQGNIDKFIHGLYSTDMEIIAIM